MSKERFLSIIGDALNNYSRQVNRDRALKENRDYQEDLRIAQAAQAEQAYQRRRSDSQADFDRDQQAKANSRKTRVQDQIDRLNERTYAELLKTAYGRKGSSKEAERLLEALTGKNIPTVKTFGKSGVSKDETFQKLNLIKSTLANERKAYNSLFRNSVGGFHALGSEKYNKVYKSKRARDLRKRIKELENVRKPLESKKLGTNAKPSLGIDF